MRYDLILSPNLQFIASSDPVDSVDPRSLHRVLGNAQVLGCHAGQRCWQCNSQGCSKHNPLQPSLARVVGHPSKTYAPVIPSRRHTKDNLPRSGLVTSSITRDCEDKSIATKIESAQRTAELENNWGNENNANPPRAYYLTVQ